MYSFLKLWSRSGSKQLRSMHKLTSEPRRRFHIKETAYLHVRFLAFIAMYSFLKLWSRSGSKQLRSMYAQAYKRA
jgi:hypothetical protein